MARRRPPGRGFRGGRRRRRVGGGMTQPQRTGLPPGSEVELPEMLGVQELADRLDLTGIDVIKQLMRDGVMANLTQAVDYETAAMVTTDLGYRPRPMVKEQAGATGPGRGASAEKGEGIETRPPVVTILGHVDHGKTTLLDTIRQSKVAEGETGGITQHIGAYQVEVAVGEESKKRITFLDTPGHEAFTAMRARGARVTDIAVLVVAADDGVMPQTVEAMDHAKAAGVPVVVAINKVDQADANVERVKAQLLERGLVLEELGGDVIAVPVSAKTGAGVEELLENLLVVAEVGELTAEPERLAEGVVIEARIDRARGPVATVLVQNGTLHVGEPVVAGEAWGRVKAMADDGGRPVREAGPSQPVEILGLDRAPHPGDTVMAFSEDRKAREYVQEQERQRERLPTSVMRAPSLEDISGQIGSGQTQELRVIVKADVQGSVEPVRDSLEVMGREGARVRLLHAAAGSINESDVLLATASGAMIIGFNVEAEPGAKRLAEDRGVEIRGYKVIYALLEEVGKALEGVLEPVEQEVVEGHGEVRAVFSVGRRTKVAGLYITDGRASRGARGRVLRGGEQLCEGAVTTLKRFKDDAREVTAGLECGVTIDGCTDFQEGDTFEFYRTQTVSPV